MSKNLKGSILLILATVLWGISFPMQDMAGSLLPSFMVIASRSFIGTLFLFPIIYVKGKKQGIKVFENTPEKRKDLILAGLLCGAFLCVATNFQQFGIVLYPEGVAASGRSGFITALYVIFVPLFSFILKKKVGLNVFIAAIISAVGMFFLSFSEGISSIYFGDVLVLVSAFGFTAQILCVDYFSDRVDGVKLSMLQFFFCGIFSTILSLIFESPNPSNFLPAAPYILYLGVVSCGVAYTFQIIGQQLCENPTVASVLMSLESVFAALAGMVILGQFLMPREILGCVIMFVAIIFAQVPFPKIKKPRC